MRSTDAGRRDPAGSRLMRGLLIAIILMLYQAACNIILVIHPHKEHDHLVVSEEKG